MRKISAEAIREYEQYLICEEKSENTIVKYIRDITAFMEWLNHRELCKAAVLAYKHWLSIRYKIASINSIISSLNNFFSFKNWFSLRLKTIKLQRNLFADTGKELTKPEYARLLQAAKTNKRLYYLMQTICATGIRVSELKFITTAAISAGKAVISCKGKTRTVFLPKRLCKMLKSYIKSQKITSGCIFVTRSGKPLDRSNIWADMKRLCNLADVPKAKTFPHNLRHLFARTYYSQQKDIVRLADLLGHSNINTTRIYTMETGETHRKQIEMLGLLRC